MLRSFLIKLAMLGATVALVLWMGWPAGDRQPEAPAPVTVPPPVVQAQAAPAKVPEGAAQTAREHERARRPSLLDLNRATPQDLEGLPGVGPVLARRIVQWRHDHGRFRSVEDLNAVKGIGDKKLGSLRHLVTVGPATMTPSPAVSASPAPTEGR